MRRCGEGEISPVWDIGDDQKWSGKYQWLPTDFEIAKESDAVRSVIHMIH